MKKWMVVLMLFFCAACQSTHEPVRKNYLYFAMNTEIILSFYDVDNPDSYAKEVEAIYLTYDAVASDYQTGGSTLSVYDLNQQREATVSDALLELIEFAQQMEIETDGYFNPLMGRLTHRWKEALEEKRLLSDEEVNRELEIIKQSSITIEGNTVSLTGDANLDLGGIAKGFATEKAKQYLEQQGITSYLISAGSSNIVLGNKAGNVFSVGLNKAFENDYYKILKLKEKDVVTSSMMYQSYEVDGIHYSHLLNPYTGKPATYYESITLIGDDSAKLDAYSTAVFAMNLETAKAFLSKHQIEWLAARNNEILYQSAGVSSYE